MITDEIVLRFTQIIFEHFEECLEISKEYLKNFDHTDEQSFEKYILKIVEKFDCKKIYTDCEILIVFDYLESTIQTIFNLYNFLKDKQETLNEKSIDNINNTIEVLKNGFLDYLYELRNV